MSRSLTSLPADYQVATISSATGFNAGEYVYLTSSGYIGQPTVGAGTVTTGTYVSGGTTGFFTGGGPVSGGASLMFGPSNISATYSGSAITAGSNRYGPASIATGGSGGLCRAATLSSGNIVIVYANGASIYFQILNDAGTVIVAQTLIGSNRDTGQPNNFAIAATATGDRFCVFYNTSQPRPVGFVYTNAGVAVGNATVNFSTAGNQQYQAAASVNGTFFLTYYNTNNDRIYWASVTNGGVLNSDSSQATNTSGATGGMCLNIDYNSGQSNSVLGTAWSSGNLSFYAFRFTSAGSMSSATANNVQSIDQSPATTAYYQTSNSTATACSVRGDGTNMYAQIWYGSGYASSPGRVVIGATNQAIASVSPTAAGYCVMYLNSSGFRTYSLGTLTTGTTATYTWSTPVVCDNVAYNGGTTINNMSVYSNNGSAVWVNTAGSSTSVNLQAAYTQSVAVGSTVTGAGLTSPQYNFVGVALNSCPAGGSGQVLIRGTAGLNSNYQNLASAVGYDFTNGGSPVSNRGVVGGRSVTLYGNNK